MAKGKSLGSSNYSKTDPRHKDYWATPQWVVDNLFTLVEHKLMLVPKHLERVDVCANEINTKCPRFINEEMNTLTTPWGHNKLCWLNPPYSNVLPFIEKAVEEAKIRITQAEAEAKQRTLQADAEAHAIKVKGQAEADSAKALAEALAKNQDLVALKTAEKWNGVLPTYIPQGTVMPFVQLPNK